MDSGGNQYDGNIYAKGSTKTVYAYMPVSDKLYKAGARKTAQGYSPYGDVYTAGTPVTKIGTPHYSGTYYSGNGKYVHDRGTVQSVKVQGDLYEYNSTLYRLTSSNTYVKVGVNLYRAGTSKDYYPGNGSSGYLRGSEVDAIPYDGVLYEAGPSVTPVGLTVSGLYRADDNENWTYTPIGSVMSNVYQRNPEDDETFDTVGSRLSLKAAEVTTQNVTALTV